MQWLTTVLLLAAAVDAAPSPRQRRAAPTSPDLLTDISVIETHWGQLTPYGDNADNYFGVVDIGLPGGCQIEQVHTLQRHANRFPTGSFDDGLNDANFAAKVMNWTSVNATEKFTGPLVFLNSYEYILSSSYLTGLGAASEVLSGVQFWNRYGRTLYNASVGQLAYNASFPNGTARKPPVLRTTSQSRIHNSLLNWALGFFGVSFEETPNPTLANFSAPFSVVIIPEGGTENNTLASYDACANDNLSPGGILGDLDLLSYVKVYLANATARMQSYAPKGFTFTVNDTYAMQSICAYETNYISQSDFCTLFTEDEWDGFEATLDLEYYYDYSFGNPTGRAQGIGYLQELIARLENEYILTSNSTVNSTYDDNAKEFPLGQKFYADFSHDDILISVLTAASLDYLHEPVNLTQYPPDPSRHFMLSHLTPFGARLITEVIGCAAADPVAVAAHRTQYTPSQYGYSASNASHKFIRMRLNNGILPLSTIRGGGCGNRTDGLCTMSGFLKSQQDAYALSNFDYACFGNYTPSTTGVDYDGTIFANETSS